MKEHTIEQIEQDNNSVRRKAFKGLLEWQRQLDGHSEDEMIQRLKNVLVSVDRNDLCQELGKFNNYFNLRSFNYNNIKKSIKIFKPFKHNNGNTK